MDWNKILDAGDVANGKINVVVEIPKGSNNKVEWRRKLKVFEVDRIEPAIFAKPANYGFIPQTLDEDGDELDAFVITNDPLPMNTFIKTRVLGVVKFVDGGEVDDKILTAPMDDRDSGDQIKTLADVPAQLLKQLEFHLNHYKDLKKPGSTEVVEIGDRDEAIRLIRVAQNRWTEQ